MIAFRLIARLDIKYPHLVKGVNLEGLRKIGDPAEHARRYYAEGADEIHYQDIVASLYGRHTINELITETSEAVLIPVTVGGGIRTVADIHALFRCGCVDKISLNTAAVERPALITEAADAFGSQCVAVNIETHQDGSGSWEVLTHSGRERSGLSAVAWAATAIDHGAGEIIITSVDRDGTGHGFDCDLARIMVNRFRVPIVMHGGCGSVDHIAEVARLGVSGVEIASLLHYKRKSIGEIKAALIADGIEVRGAE